MPLIDVTARLLGDPCARKVRDPLPNERNRERQSEAAYVANVGRPIGLRVPGVRSKLLDPVPVGGTIEAPTLAQARNYVRWFREVDRTATLKANGDGSYTVTRRG